MKLVQQFEIIVIICIIMLLLYIKDWMYFELFDIMNIFLPVKHSCSSASYVIQVMEVKEK